MLKSLHIENMAVVRCLDFEFDRGLTVFTGETGAGKSVITDCIKFLICNKISRELLRTGETRGLVNAVFSDLSDTALNKLADLGIDVSDREITLDTKEIRAILENVPLDTFEVLQWIRDNLADQYARK